MTFESLKGNINVLGIVRQRVKTAKNDVGFMKVSWLIQL